jgi:hypothetical protein
MRHGVKVSIKIRLAGAENESIEKPTISWSPAPLRRKR